MSRAKRYFDSDLSFIKLSGHRDIPEDELEEETPKSLTNEHKQAIWNAYAQKTAREEIMFKRVFDSVFEGQKNEVIEGLKETGKLPELDDGKTAQKFQPAIELVYNSAFEDAV